MSVLCYCGIKLNIEIGFILLGYAIARDCFFMSRPSPTCAGLPALHIACSPFAIVTNGSHNDLRCYALLRDRTTAPEPADEQCPG